MKRISYTKKHSSGAGWWWFVIEAEFEWTIHFLLKKEVYVINILGFSTSLQRLPF